MERDRDEVAVDPSVADRLRSVLADVGPADLELVSPPPSVWAGIRAAIDTGPEPSPRTPPARRTAGTVVEYRIDGADVVTAMGQGWVDFARDNDAPELAAPSTDRTLWTYFDSEETVELWRLLVERVRASQVAIEVPLRCDGPAARRWFDLTLTPEADGGVHFRCASVFEEARTPLSLLDSQAERDDALPPVALCSWCSRGEHESQWYDLEELVRVARLLERPSVPPTVHGICSSCREEMSATLLVSGASTAN